MVTQKRKATIDDALKAIEAGEFTELPPLGDSKRKTFTVPDGSEAVRDSDGRATGDIYDGRPLPGNGNGDPALQGAELLAEAAAEPTMDRYLDGSPKLLTDKDWAEFVTVLQRKRALFITAEQKRKEPKIEGEDE